jgi:uncharacterized damage-inducible protein DinB
VSVRRFYADWAGYNRRAIEGIKRLTEADLALRVHAVRDLAGDPWPLWAVFAHPAATRVFWLCDVFGEQGAEGTPFGGNTKWWEDDLSHPRGADELVGAWETTWQVVEGCLGRWTPDSLGQESRRERPDGSMQVHTRQSVLLRMINHEAYHLGEINLALGANGREPIDPWPAADWREGAPVSLREG